MHCTATQGLCNTTLQFSAATNRINAAGYAYDAAGNLTSDGSAGYQWDAEGRLKSVDNGASRSYVYNAGGAYIPTVLVGMYATQGRYNVRGLKHYYGLNHPHYLTTRPYRRARFGLAPTNPLHISPFLIHNSPDD